MPTQSVISSENRHWRLLLVYNFYRILSVLLLLGIYFSSSGETHPALFSTLLFFYFLCTLLFMYASQSRSLRFERLVFLSGTIDVIAIAVLLTIIGNLRFGHGILLNVTIAALSILAPGRLAIYFAAVASCLLLVGNVLQYWTESRDLGSFYYSGIYGAGFFATAVTAWYLSNWARMSERLAEMRSEELARMQRINEYIVEHMHAGIIYIDAHLHINLLNSAAREFFNLDESKPMSVLTDVSPSLAKKCELFLATMKTNGSIAQTVIEKPYLRAHLFFTEVLHNPAVLIILEDMTYINQQAQQLKLASLGRFSASIAHELRNPLWAIAHAGQLLGEQGLSSEDERLKQLIINNCERMNGVIKNVLQISRRQQSQPQLIELPLFLEQFKEHFYHSKECNLLVKPTKKGVALLFDRSQLEQVLVVLCENALQHGRSENGLVDIVITAKKGANKVVLQISNSGPIIAPEHKDTIFEPFFTTLRTGTGMGLFIAKDLCEMNQAQLSLVDTTAGCVFAITQHTVDDLLI